MGLVLCICDRDEGNFSWNYNFIHTLDTVTISLVMFWSCFDHVVAWWSSLVHIILKLPGLHVTFQNYCHTAKSMSLIKKKVHWMSWFSSTLIATICWMTLLLQAGQLWREFCESSYFSSDWTVLKGWSVLYKPLKSLFKANHSRLSLKTSPFANL